MDVQALANALTTAVQQANDEKATLQADIDAKTASINDLKVAIKDDQGTQGEDDTIIAAAQEFLAALAPFLPAPAPVVAPPVAE